MQCRLNLGTSPLSAMAAKYRSSFSGRTATRSFLGCKKSRWYFRIRFFIAQRQWYAYRRSFNRPSLSTRRSNPAHQWCPSLTISSILLWRQTYLPVHPFIQLSLCDYYCIWLQDSFGSQRQYFGNQYIRLPVERRVSQIEPTTWISKSNLQRCQNRIFFDRRVLS